MISEYVAKSYFWAIFADIIQKHEIIDDNIINAIINNSKNIERLNNYVRYNYPEIVKDDKFIIMIDNKNRIVLLWNGTSLSII